MGIEPKTEARQARSGLLNEKTETRHAKNLIAQIAPKKAKAKSKIFASRWCSEALAVTLREPALREGPAREGAVYLPRTSNRLMWCFWGFWTNAESITYGFSLWGDVPSPVVPAIHSKRSS
jgi:hypothetical protein